MLAVISDMCLKLAFQVVFFSDFVVWSVENKRFGDVKFVQTDGRVTKSDVFDFFPVKASA